MRSSFQGYYPPTEAEFSELWSEGTVVLDTNVLLNLYRLPPDSREEFLNVLKQLQNRLWIPYHVGLEFQRNRLKVISDQNKKMTKSLSDINSSLDQVEASIRSINLEKHGINDIAEKLLSSLISLKNDMNEAVQKAVGSYGEVSSRDPIGDKIVELLSRRVGDGPACQDDVAALVLDAAARFDRKIPPGFNDSDKGRDRGTATFYHRGLEYERAYGDLIVWRQIIAHARSSASRKLIFVTADTKGDWWWEHEGKTLGPHPDLVDEIRRESGIAVFWMYSSVQFLEQAKTNLSAKVSPKSVSDLESLRGLTLKRKMDNFSQSESPDIGDVDAELLLNAGDMGDNSQAEMSEDGESRPSAETAVYRWLLARHPSVTKNIGFPDFRVDDDIVSGFEVKVLRNFRDLLFPPAAVNAMLRGYLEINERRLDAFHLVLIISEEDRRHILLNDKSSLLSSRLLQILRRYPITSIILGSIVDGNFRAIASIPS